MKKCMGILLSKRIVFELSFLFSRIVKINSNRRFPGYFRRFWPRHSTVRPAKEIEKLVHVCILHTIKA